MLLSRILKAFVDQLLNLDLSQHWIEDFLSESVQQSKRAFILALQIPNCQFTLLTVVNELFCQLLDCCFCFNVVPHDVLRIDSSFEHFDVEIYQLHVITHLLTGASELLVSLLQSDDLSILLSIAPMDRILIDVFRLTPFVIFVGFDNVSSELILKGLLFLLRLLRLLLESR